MCKSCFYVVKTKPAACSKCGTPTSRAARNETIAKRIYDVLAALPGDVNATPWAAAPDHVRNIYRIAAREALAI